MSQPKYTIFISSTYIDLVEERDQVIKAVLEMGHIPIGMEMFSAADDEQWDIIKAQIDQTDYYVVIVAHRYGSIEEETGISYTEKEFDYAVKQGIPVLGFIISDEVKNWPHDRYERNTENTDKLNSFKGKIKYKRQVAFWTSKESLYGQTTNALAKAFNTKPRPGWVRATEGGLEVTAELARLSSENALNRERITELESLLKETKINESENEPVVITLKADLLVNNRRLEFTRSLSTTWNALFIAIAEKLLNRPTENSMHNAIVSHFSSSFDEFLRSDFDEDAKVSREKEVEVDSVDFQLIKAHFLGLGFIKTDFKAEAHSFRSYWKLTPEGERHYGKIKSRIAVKNM